MCNLDRVQDLAVLRKNADFLRWIDHRLDGPPHLLAVVLLPRHALLRNWLSQLLR